jgi:hypothetical protein
MAFRSIIKHSKVLKTHQGVKIINFKNREMPLHLVASLMNSSSFIVLLKLINLLHHHRFHRYRDLLVYIKPQIKSIQAWVRFKMAGLLI